MLVHVDGFDSYSVVADLSLEYVVGGNVTFSTSGGRFGGGSPNLMSASGYLVKTLAIATTELWVGYAIKPITTYASPSSLLGLSSGAGGELSFCYNAGSLVVTKGSYAGTVLYTATAPQNFMSGIWHWIEFHYKYGSSAGVAEIWFDGVQVLSWTGNTTSSGGGGISQVSLAQINSNVTCNVDDFYIIDVAAGGANTTRLGDCRIGTLLPTANASPNQATPSSGNAFACVNEAQWNTSNYVTFTPYAAGMVELYTLGSLPSTPTAIFGVRTLAIADKSDAGSAGLYPLVKSNGSLGTGTSQPLSTSWGHVSGIFETDPHTSAAWTTAAVNAMACGVQTV